VVSVCPILQTGGGSYDSKLKRGVTQEAVVPTWQITNSSAKLNHTRFVAQELLIPVCYITMQFQMRSLWYCNPMFTCYWYKSTVDRANHQQSTTLRRGIICFLPILLYTAVQFPAGATIDFFSSLPHPDRLWGPLSPLCNEYRGLLTRG